MTHPAATAAQTGKSEALARGCGRLDGHVAIVTGGGWGGQPGSVGNAICRVFAREGARVAVVDKLAAAAEKTVAAIQEQAGDAVALVGDVSREADCHRLVDDTVARYGRLDVLVNNVGILSGSPVADVVEEQWDAVMAVNLKSSLMMAKYAIRAMPQGGSIVNLSSIATTRPGISAVYAVSKAGIEALTSTIAAQYGRRGIRANCVRPGELWTSMVARDLSADDAARSRETKRLRSALQTEGTAWDVAHAALFLASDESRWITGQVLTVDGGAGLLRPDTSREEMRE